MSRRKEKKGNWSSCSPRVLVQSHTAQSLFVSDSGAASSSVIELYPPWSVNQKCYMLDNPGNEMTCLGKYKKHL